jgi:RimJ/RimL family protein N-acetyltransferase
VPGLLREVTEADVPALFALQLDPVGNHLAGIDPLDRETFAARWAGHLASEGAVLTRAIVVDGAVAGFLISFEEAGAREVGYRVARERWGQGLATRALAEFVRDVETTRPLRACVAADNVGSLRVLKKCGFVVMSRGGAHMCARPGGVVPVLLELSALAGRSEGESS